MPRSKANAPATTEAVERGRSLELEKPAESDEKVAFDEDEDPEEDEEVEYEEVEEEIEEEEEVEEVEVEEEVEEEEAIEETNNNVIGIDAARSLSGDEAMIDDDDREKHAELLALPPHGSEVYLGGIPLDASEEDLKVFCEAIGDVTEVRIMKGKDSGDNKGFAFVTFRSVELASEAIEKLNNTELKGKKVKCSKSQAKHRLFIGNIPRSWGKDDLKIVVTKVGPGVTAVELVKDMTNTHNNRGFAFIDYYNHACAEYSRQRMMNPQFKLGNNAPTVSWADPKNADSPATSQVKALYVKNLPKNVTQDQLRKLFERHGKITKVVLPPAKSGQEKNRIGFVHFGERSSAMKALKNTEKYELDGQLLECSLAKPQADQKNAGGSNSQNSALLPTYPPRVGYGFVGGAYNPLVTQYGVGNFTQPSVYGRGPSPGMAMMPMLLPDGRIGYVLQQPGVQPHIPPPHHRGFSRGGGSSSKTGGSSSKGRHDGGPGRRYRPY